MSQHQGAEFLFGIDLWLSHRRSRREPDQPAWRSRSPNGFTFVEAYLARGMDIDDFAPNLSRSFSRTGWTRSTPSWAGSPDASGRSAMRFKYGAGERAQKLKYHIQTSGRSLHAQEMDFNDIRTTLQALIAIYDNCNSLHTNAYDEAITTPTEDSLRRAIAIQMIINKEWGLAKNENPIQGCVHHRRADRPGRRSRADGVRPHHRTRRRLGRDGNRLPTRQNPRRKHALRNPEAHRRAADCRRQHLPKSKPAERCAARTEAFDRRRKTKAKSNACGTSKAATPTQHRLI